MFKTKPMSMRVEHKGHDSNILVDCYICSKCGRAEFVVNHEILLEQKRYFQQDRM